MDHLLKVLKPHHPGLPLTAKTLLKTNPEDMPEIKQFGPDNDEDDSEFVYLGIAKNLQRTVNAKLHSSPVL